MSLKSNLFGTDAGWQVWALAVVVIGALMTVVYTVADTFLA